MLEKSLCGNFVNLGFSLFYELNVPADAQFSQRLNQEPAWKVVDQFYSSYFPKEKQEQWPPGFWSFQFINGNFLDLNQN